MGRINIVTGVIVLTAQFLCAGDVVINEIMYHASNSDLEYVELYNRGSSTINLSGWYLLDDNDSHTKCVLSGTLAPGAYLVIARIVYQFQLAYPTVNNFFPTGYGSGSDAWAFGNGGDAVRLFNDLGELVDIVTYDDSNGWPTAADGNGPSLELINPAYDNALPTAWRSSTVTGGTPGRINSVYTTNAAPVCKNGVRLIDLPTNADAVPIAVYAYDLEDLVAVKLMYSTGSNYITVTMNDQGNAGDAVAGDSIFTAVIPAQSSGTVVKYYCIASDLMGQTNTWPNNAPTNYRAYTVDYRPPALLITEAMAANSHTLADEFGEYDDWFEIYNNDSRVVNLRGMYVSSSLNNSMAFELPNLNLNPGEYLLVWADDDVVQGNLHADFKLSAAGEAVALWETNEHGNVLIHGWTFAKMKDDISVGFPSANSTAPEYLASPTPGASNGTSHLFSPVCINEFSTTGLADGVDDWVEIYNRGTQPVDISGYFLSDDAEDLTKWCFPQGTILPVGGFIVVDETQLGFSFTSSGDEVIVLTAADSNTVLDYYDYGPQMAARSHGRYPDGASTWCFFNTPTKGSANVQTRLESSPSNLLPVAMILYPNYPNPFNAETNIEFYLPRKSEIELGIYDLLGREVALLTHGEYPAGRYSCRWSAGNLNSGIYFCRLRAENQIKIQKLLLLK